MGADLQPCIAQSSQQRTNEIAPATSISDFQIIKKLGSGTFATVYLAKRKLDDSLYAIKCINKSLIIKQNEVKHTNDELKILLAVDHPFIVKLHAAFQNNTYLFLVLDYMKGGELFHHLQVHHRFSERQVTYWSAQILLGLEELHRHGIIMRDLKPENLLLDGNGYIKITDFGLSKYIQAADQTKQDQQQDAKPQALIGTTFCGTSEYLSPELLRNQPHTIAVDLWALGIITYELIQGIPPFYQQDNKAMFKQILKSEVQYTDRFSAVSRDFISKLLLKDPKKRMTSEQAKKHPFFKNIDFDKLYRKEYEMEFVPAKDENKNFDKEFIQEDISQAVSQFENERIDLDMVGVKDQQQFSDFKIDSRIEKIEAEKHQEQLRKETEEQQEQENNDAEALEQFDDI